MPIERFEDVKAWQKAKVLTIQIYKLFEQSKDFGFKDQIHRWSKFVTSILYLKNPAKAGQVCNSFSQIPMKNAYVNDSKWFGALFLV